MRELIINTFREGYGTDQVGRTMTVGDLIAELENYDESMPIFLSFDNGYTYGGITEERLEEREMEDDEE